MNRNSPLFDKVLGCLLGGFIGDAMGTPTENLSHDDIQQRFGWVQTFSGDGTDDSLLKHILCETLERTGGHATADAWAADWIRHSQTFVNSKLFFAPVVATFWKLSGEQVLPRDAGAGNMASSSSAMCISPMGIVNAGNPRQAVLETFEVAGLIHHNFCRDGACAMAAAVAQAFVPGTNVESVLRAASEFLPERSAEAMRVALQSTLAMARESAGYKDFRARYYSAAIDVRRHFTDSRETVPLALALVWLADGDAQKAVEYGANFGRDADTIASMAGAVAGAMRGASALPQAWLDTLGSQADKQRALADRMTRLVHARAEAARAAALIVLETSA
ncbi:MULTISPECIES: ADP-ribosylglycohydrolase family protein [Paraburkholderia]|uniref:ADP-ribosylglycohydrolase n=1 Tax=Paraburkholderia phenazinium TaxID=60549 RepID=A0A1N6HYP9_9BURK|nr:ADP-ribosylglycohydrolase family protein [Paraburkholderia phenazinium]SIO24932.1 ADP-ribosylglycohydrolase [Paraburkholderia phenazinium]